MGAVAPLEGPPGRRFPQERACSRPATQGWDPGGEPSNRYTASVPLRPLEGSRLGPGTHEEYVLVSSAQLPSTFSAICSPLLRQ